MFTARKPPRRCSLWLPGGAGCFQFTTQSVFWEPLKWLLLDLLLSMSLLLFLFLFQSLKRNFFHIGTLILPDSFLAEKYKLSRSRAGRHLFYLFILFFLNIFPSLCMHLTLELDTCTWCRSHSLSIDLLWASATQHNTTKHNLTIEHRNRWHTFFDCFLSKLRTKDVKKYFGFK